jgi:hypothetical protein
MLPGGSELHLPDLNTEEKPSHNKHPQDESGDERFFMNEFFYYNQNFLTLKGVFLL